MNHASLLTLAFVSAFLANCLPGPDPDAVTNVDVSATYVCSDDLATSSTLTIDRVYACIYRPAESRLQLEVENATTELSDDFITINIVDFTGVKQYTTNVGEDITTENFVVMNDAFDELTVDTHTSDPFDTPCGGDYSCTFDVTNADIIDAGAGGIGRLTVAVTCAPLRLSSGCDTCTFTPATWNFDIVDCGRDDG